MNEPIAEFIERLPVLGSNRRGRPYCIKRLLVRFGIRPNVPRKLTDEMRLKLAIELEQKGIVDVGVLDRQCRTAKLWRLAPDPVSTVAA